MASPAYELILEIQALDLTVDRLRHRAATHPERERLSELGQRLASHDEATAEVEERRHDLERQRKRLEDEVALLEDRRKDIDGKLYGGQVTASKELLALQDEAAGLLERQNGLEETELELMEQLEELGDELSKRSATRAEMEAERSAAEAGLAAALAEIDTEIADAEAKRVERVGAGPDLAPGWDELLVRYGDLRPQYDGVPVARLVQGRCDGCHMQLSAMAVDQIGKMADDAVVTCEECGRLLVR